MDYKVVKLAKKLVSIPSISPLDLGCQDIISLRLKKIGFIIKNFIFNNTNNLWAYKGYGDNFVFLGHTDVVPPGNLNQWKFNPFKPTIENNILYGRGISDMKGSIAAMVIAVENFVKKYPNYLGKISFLITSDEESKALDGTKKVIEYLLRKNEIIKYCLIGEPTNKKKLGDTIKNGRRGSLNIQIKIYGIQGHIAYPKLLENPIHKSIPFLNDLINLKWDNGNFFFSKSSLQISGIHSGEKNCSNVVPGSLQVNLNIRFNTEITLQVIKKKIKFLLLKHKLKNSIYWFFSGHPFLTKKKKFLSILKKSIKQVVNLKSSTSTSGGTSDGRFVNKMDCEILEFGLINSTIHKVNECANINDLKNLQKIYELTLKNIFINK
ncbi:succinyl-diaminopimelate desuccinylase [Buchnera aphidicola]|uniref:succinyl-diaminopimelate desuccinylase n=1 Tax=Buchnera aphidicola TaxID=9 RepID=UPI0030EC75E7